MRAVLIGVVLVLLFFLVRNSSSLDAGLTYFNPVLLGYGALFVAGVVAAELLRPVLSLLSAGSRFVVVVLLAGLVWFGFDQARQAGILPDFQVNESGRAGSKAPVSKPLTVLSPAWDGVYRAVAQINNRSIGVLVHMATPLVLLQYEEAVRLGFRPESLTFKDRITVSDHKVKAAKITLGTVRIDAITVLNVEAAIAEKGAIETSLIGLSFLDRLSVVALKDGTLVLGQ